MATSSSAVGPGRAFEAPEVAPGVAPPGLRMATVSSTHHRQPRVVGQRHQERHDVGRRCRRRGGRRRGRPRGTEAATSGHRPWWVATAMPRSSAARSTRRQHRLALVDARMSAGRRRRGRGRPVPPPQPTSSTEPPSGSTSRSSRPMTPSRPDRPVVHREVGRIEAPRWLGRAGRGSPAGWPSRPSSRPTARLASSCGWALRDHARRWRCTSPRSGNRSPTRCRDRPAIVHGGVTPDVAGVRRPCRPGRRRRSCAAGLGPDSKVGLLLYNCNEYLEAQYGAFKMRGGRRST